MNPKPTVPCLVLLSFLLALYGCSAGGGEDAKAFPDAPTAETATGDAVFELILGKQCQDALDCGEQGVCMSSVWCSDGDCKYTFQPAGTPCTEGCYVNGVCSGDGTCEELELMDCPEQDGNICTVPECSADEGTCIETPVEDGAEPYISSECWDGVICVGGVQDNTAASPTELALECEEMNEGLAPFSCVDSYMCVGGVEKCKSLSKVDGVQCWIDSPGTDNECDGRSCLAGECVIDHELDAICEEEDLPEECDGGCKQCTLLTCHWIPDPATPANPTKKVRYCQPAAALGQDCSAGGCMLEQVCAFGGSTDGPMGKETLGLCAGGVEKSKEQCLDEMGKPAVACLLAAVACDQQEGGCYLDQDKADKWCWPPEWKCFDKSDTYCTHLEGGDNWDPDTGCHTAWVELDCDDDNECTVDACKSLGNEWECEHQPVAGSACSDGNACTQGGQCADGECAGSVPKCTDQDDDPCNNPFCDPDSGECLPPQTDGIPCDDGDECTSADQCLDGGCVPGPSLDCSDGDICNGSETCAPSLGCQPGSALKCGDENVCNGVETCHPVLGCQDGQGLVCDDSNVCNGIETCHAVDGCQPGTPLSCADESVCNGQETCSPTEGCQDGTPMVCDDSNPCTDDQCDPAQGCQFVNNSAPCDDKNASTEGDYCAYGNCVPGAVVDCDDDNPCTSDLVDPVAGCKYQNVEGACDDYDVCTIPDACAGGKCVPGPEIDCEDGKFCTVDTCHPVSGCLNTNLPDDTPCPGGLNNSCKQGVCICIPNCGGKNCGTDGCSGSCGSCQGETQCVSGICEGSGGFNPSGEYGLSDLVYLACAAFMGPPLININFSTMTFVDDGKALDVKPTMNTCCMMSGPSAKDKNISVSCVCEGGGACEELYSLTGSFSDDNNWSGTVTAQYSGMFCFDCPAIKTWNVTGSK